MDAIARFFRLSDRARVARNVVELGPHLAVCTLDAGECKNEREYARFAAALRNHYGHGTLLVTVPPPNGHECNASDAHVPTGIVGRRVPFSTAGDHGGGSGGAPSPALAALDYMVTVTYPCRSHPVLDALVQIAADWVHGRPSHHHHHRLLHAFHRAHEGSTAASGGGGAAAPVAPEPHRIVVLHSTHPDTMLMAACIAAECYPGWGLEQLEACVASAVATAVAVRERANAAVPPWLTPFTPSARRFLHDRLEVRAAREARGADALAQPIRLVSITLLTLPTIGLVAGKGDSPAPTETPQAGRGGRPGATPATAATAATAAGSRRGSVPSAATPAGARRWSVVLPWSQAADFGLGARGTDAASAPRSAAVLGPVPMTGRIRVHSCHLFMVIVYRGEIVYNSLLTEPGVRVLPSTTPAVTFKIKGPPLRLHGTFSVRFYHRRTSHAPLRLAAADLDTGAVSRSEARAQSWEGG